MTKTRPCSRGISFVELAISLLIISIAIIPVIVMTSGQLTGEATVENKRMTQEKSVANTLMEKATSNHPDFTSIVKKTNILKSRHYGHKTSTEIAEYDNSGIYYRWILRNLTYSNKTGKRILPDGNYLLDVSLEIFNSTLLKEKKTPSLTMGTKILMQEPKEAFEMPIIGIMFLIDMTPSMSMSNYGWGHNPMATVNPEAGKKNSVAEEDLPVFSKNTKPDTVLDYVYKHCSPSVTYKNGFGYPQQKYTNADDFVFASNEDNPNTEYDERYLPLYTKRLVADALYSHPLGQDAAINYTKKRYEELRKAVDKAYGIKSISLANSALSRIEMVRSSLYNFLYFIEKEDAGPRGIFKLGILPFADTAKKSYMLKPTSVDTNGKFSEFRKYVKSINRSGAPKTFSFNLVTSKQYTTDIEGALKLAHKALIDDKSLTNRIIVLVTDWNHCIEIPKVIDDNPTRSCITNIIKQLQKEELKIIAILEQRIKNDSSYTPDPNDPLMLRLKTISETKEWLLKFLPNPKNNAELKAQPYHPLYGKECQLIKKSVPLSTLAKKISDGTINNAQHKKTDIYVLGIIDAGRPPAVNILANMTAESKNGEFLVAKTIYDIPDLFNFVVMELNRLTKLKQAERYAFNKNK